MSLREHVPPFLSGLLTKPVALMGPGPRLAAVQELLGRLGSRFSLFETESAGRGEDAERFSAHDAGNYGLVIHTTAFESDHPWLARAREAGCEVLSEMDFAQQLRKGPTLVVTGTNGKTTLQEFMTFSLKRSGQSAMAVGQHQYPLSKLAVHPELDGMTAVCELDPHYAWALKTFRFDALFWTNFHEDHLEDADQRRRLFEAILNLAGLSSGAGLYFGNSVFEAAEELGCVLPERARPLEMEDYPDWVLPHNSAFATSIHRSALALFRRYWLDQGMQDSLLKSAAENFEVRAHRLHVLSIIGKTVFWNDSKASNFAAAEAALSHFEEPVVWIGGGHFRGGDIEAFLERIRPFIKAAVLIGDVRQRICEILQAREVPCVAVDDLREAVAAAFAYARGNAPVVFSPGFIAGEQYGDFSERGMCYENAVLGLKHQKGSL